MRLPKLAIANYQFVLVLVFMAVALGTLSLLNMPRSEDPALDFPRYNIVAVYPGASPRDMEELVVDPIEEAVNEVEDLDRILTTVRDGLAVIGVEGEFGLDYDEQYDEIVAQVNSIRDQLPSGLVSLEVSQFSPQDVSILQMAMVGEGLPYRQLIEYAERLEDRLEKVDGVRSVELNGYPEEEVRIALDFEKMAQLGVPLNQVLNVLRSNNANIPAGTLKAGSRAFSVKTSGGYRTLAELENTVISASPGQMLRLKEVGKVYYGYEDPQWIARFNGERGIFISVTQKSGQNILSLTEKLEAEMLAFEGSLPASVDLSVAFIQAPAVANRINEFFANLLQGIALVALVIFLFLGFRNALIISTVIPTSILIAINVLDFSGFGLQQISIAGLVIALGLLVDNGIVVVENINRYLKMGAPLKEAAAKGTAEVGWAIVSSTVTTVLAFFPLSQLGGGTGAFLQSLPAIVIYALVASLVLALAFTPLLASRLMKDPAKVKARRKGVSDWMQGRVQGLIERVYRPALAFSFRRPWLILLLGVSSLAGSMALFPLVGVSFFPTADKPLLVIDVDLPQGAALSRTDEATRYVEHTLAQEGLVASYASSIGHGNPQIYYNIIPKNLDATHAQLIVNLEEWESESFYALIDRLRGEFAAYSGAQISVRELKNGPPYEAPIAIKVLGDDLAEINRLSDQVKSLIEGEKGTINVENPLEVAQTNLRAQVRRDEAGMLGVSLADIDGAIRTAVTGNEIGTFNTDAGDKYPLVVSLAYEEGQAARVTDFQRVSLGSFSGAQVPLPQLIDLEFESDAARIDHFDLARANTLTADVAEGANVTAITERLIVELENMPWPDGYSYFVAGEYETQQESFGDLGQMLVVAILGIFAVLILQFRSFRQPFVVLSAIPLALSGSIVALFLTGWSFSFFAFVGFTSLVGIVVNTSIILVDYTNQLREQGQSVREAIQQAAETRFTPILLTTLTTISGLLPLTLTNSGLWSPLGWTIIGGMVSSTLLTLLVVPILYRLLTPETQEVVGV
ncbi:MAG: efflux RND transporter permease subunit [Bacteroidota bacterium]